MLPALALVFFLHPGCTNGRDAFARREATRLYPPAPQPPKVVALGTLRGAAAPSQASVDVSLFLFGAEPPPPLTIANPTGLATDAEAVYVCDNALSSVFRWEVRTNEVRELAFDPPLEHPFALDLLPNGDRLICDRRGVWRYDGAGRLINRYEMPAETAFRPSGVLGVQDEVWVTNIAAHRIEIFELTGRHLRSLGGGGPDEVQLALPRGLAHTPDGDVCVIDMLNNRVEVLGPDGSWRRDIGQGGDAVGSFGRPKDVAIGPDGVFFVTDSFSQRVHAIGPNGQPLLAFGEPGSGVGELRLPAGIAVTRVPPPALGPEGEATRHVLEQSPPEYYILVAEQLHEPGVRVYAWLPPRDEAGAPLPVGEARSWQPAFPGSAAINPHWDPHRCTTCHAAEGERIVPIPQQRVDELCLSCHDGLKAPAEPHPIGRPAQTDLVATPVDWPAPNGIIGCLTCHDILRHCDVDARRPAVNYVLLRGYDPQRPLEYCSVCHKTDVGGRFSPHRQRDATGKVREDACLFCHTATPPIPPDGRRRFDPHLRTETSALCINCHPPHWDLSPKGHVDRPVTPRIRQWMLMRELALEQPQASPAELARRAEQLRRDPARVPLGSGMVTCYSCHNPHYTGLFPENSELGALAENPLDRKSALRTDWIDLCSECHHH